MPDDLMPDDCMTARMPDHLSEHVPTIVNPAAATPGCDVGALIHAIRSVLTDDLLKPEYRARAGRKPSAGHCYSAAQALYHLLGGKAAGLTPVQLAHEGDSHWCLRTAEGTYLDPTADQFTVIPPYERGIGRGFQTRLPDKRAAEIIRRVHARGAVEDPVRSHA